MSTRIRNAIDAGSGLADGGKPTCVVIDEVDGATGGDQVCLILENLNSIQWHRGTKQVEEGNRKHEKAWSWEADSIELRQEFDQIDTRHTGKQEE